VVEGRGSTPPSHRPAILHSSGGEAPTAHRVAAQGSPGAARPANWAFPRSGAPPPARGLGAPPARQDAPLAHLQWPALIGAAPAAAGGPDANGRARHRRAPPRRLHPHGDSANERAAQHPLGAPPPQSAAVAVAVPARPLRGGGTAATSVLLDRPHRSGRPAGLPRQTRPDFDRPQRRGTGRRSAPIGAAAAKRAAAQTGGSRSKGVNCSEEGSRSKKWWRRAAAAPRARRRGSPPRRERARADGAATPPWRAPRPQVPAADPRRPGN